MARKPKNNNTSKKSLSSRHHGASSRNSSASNNSIINRNNRRRSGRQRSNRQNMDDSKLRNKIEEDGLMIEEMYSDGNCLFRSLSDQLFGDHGNGHDQVRSDVCDFIESNEEEFKLFLVFDDDEGTSSEDAADFQSYIADMREDATWGGNLELVAAARLYHRRISVYSASLSAFTIDHNCPTTSGKDLLLSFHDGDHYNSVRTKDVGKPHRIKEQQKITINPKATKALSPNIKGMKELSMNDGKGGGEVASTKSIKRNAPCLCGSGLRYKKCCFAKDRAVKKRLASGKNSSPEKYDDNDNDEIQMKGNFRAVPI